VVDRSQLFAIIDQMKEEAGASASSERAGKTKKIAKR
jgi:hypothetical protein